MLLHINGEAQEVTGITSVTELLAYFELREDRVAVEVNLEIVRREQRSTFLLHDADKIEIVSFIGGG